MTSLSIIDVVTLRVLRVATVMFSRDALLFLLSPILGAHVILFNAISALFTPWFASIHWPENPTSLKEKGEREREKIPLRLFLSVQ